MASARFDKDDGDEDDESKFWFGKDQEDKKEEADVVDLWEDVSTATEQARAQAVRMDIVFEKDDAATTAKSGSGGRAAPILWNANLHPRDECLSKHETDMLSYPKPQDFAPPPLSNGEGSTRHVIIGDLHGNAIKLLYTLIVERALDIAPTTASSAADKNQVYNRLCEIISTPNAPIQLLREFSAIVDKDIVLITPPSWCARTQLHFLGDEFADRGQNDYFSISLFAKLARADGGGGATHSLEILLSNHGCIFYKYCVLWMLELDALGAQGSRTAKMMASITGNAMERATQSLHALHRIIPSLTAQEQVRIARDVMQIIRLLTPLACFETGRDLVVLTHAPINVQGIQRMARRALANNNGEEEGIADQQLSKQELAALINSVRETFKTKLAGNTRLYCGGNGNHSPLETIFSRLIYPRLDDEALGGPLPARAVSGICLVHGHDGRIPAQTEYGYCLDNTLGKNCCTDQQQQQGMDSYCALRFTL